MSEPHERLPAYEMVWDLLGYELEWFGPTLVIGFTVVIL